MLIYNNTKENNDVLNIEIQNVKLIFTNCVQFLRKPATQSEIHRDFPVYFHTAYYLKTFHGCFHLIPLIFHSLHIKVGCSIQLTTKHHYSSKLRIRLSTLSEKKCKIVYCFQNKTMHKQSLNLYFTQRKILEGTARKGFRRKTSDWKVKLKVNTKTDFLTL
jgi:hypothetical protein